MFKTARKRSLQIVGGTLFGFSLAYFSTLGYASCVNRECVENSLWVVGGPQCVENDYTAAKIAYATAGGGQQTCNYGLCQQRSRGGCSCECGSAPAYPRKCTSVSGSMGTPYIILRCWCQPGT